MNLILPYQNFIIFLEGYNDVYWIPLSYDSKMTNRYIFSMTRGTFSWKSKKYMILTRYTMELYIIAPVTSNKEENWLTCSLADTTRKFTFSDRTSD